MQNLFEFPEDLQQELGDMIDRFLSGQPECNIDTFVRENASPGYIACWDKNMKKLQEERKKNYIIN